MAKNNMSMLDDTDRERFMMLQRQEENGTITEDGMMQLQHLRDRMGNG